MTQETVRRLPFLCDTERLLTPEKARIWVSKQGKIKAWCFSFASFSCQFWDVNLWFMVYVFLSILKKGIYQNEYEKSNQCLGPELMPFISSTSYITP